MARGIPFFDISLLLLTNILFQLLPKLALSASHTTVKYLPGFEGPLPFHLETGYVGVGESEEVQLFYYFIKSERNPKEDPLMLWISGGPGCSSFSGLAYEIGPIDFKDEEYKGTLPALALNPYSWTKISSIIFMDIPVRTGFSYTQPSNDSLRADSFVGIHGNQFMRKWLIDHPEYLSNPFYVGGDSYAGMPIPAVVLDVLNGNEAGIEPSINLQGYILGNPKTEQRIEENFAIPYAHGMGLISDELYESLRRHCSGNVYNVDPKNELCFSDVQAFKKCISGIRYGHILKPLCTVASPKPLVLYGPRQRSMLEDSKALLHDTEATCWAYGDLLARSWINNNEVLKALGIRKGSIMKWQRCLYEPYTRDIPSSVPYHMNLSTKGLRALIYNGDQDMVVPFLGTQSWINSLNYTIVDNWRQWIVDGQVAGFTMTYSNRMTYATVKGAGHTAPEYKPKECFTMFERWTSGRSL